MSESTTQAHQWPSLRVDDWTATRDTLHMWAQIVGKIRLRHMPLINHWWQVTLYVTPRGLTTGAIPTRGALFDMEFDFIGHVLVIRHSDGGQESVALEPKSVAVFYGETLAALDRLGIESRIASSPNEVTRAIPFAEDYEHVSYDPAAARLFWQQLVQAQRVIARFRASFVGKVSPVHFFWGAMDLACTRFSGRPAPLHPGGAPNCPTTSWWRDTPASSAAAVSGRVAARKVPSTHTHTRNPMASPTIPSSRRVPTSASRTANSCCRTKSCAPSPIRTTRSCGFSRPRMTLLPISVVGTVPHSKAIPTDWDSCSR
jgi:uncharacterized protein DUF5996